MFARKQKGADVVASVSRFVDLHRDCFSRVKHLKNLLDSLSLQEKRQLMEEYSFETFHLVDELLLSCDVSSTPQGASEAESGLWTLEQLLCHVPELIGSGWQRHAIESLLKKAIYPHNLLSVRKIAIRLFLIFYQSLAVYNNTSPELDRVFQCLLPFFPLRSGESTELILQEYCTSTGPQWTATKSPSGGVLQRESTSSAREKAQLLQVYLDKFLEYCVRETVRIEWSDDSKRVHCARFIIDRLITLYIHETFPDLEANGVDIFGGWAGGEADTTPLDTADPVVIARYWLIRWMNNIALAKQLPPETTHAGVMVYHEALFSTHRSTNTLLSLLSEAMHLPLPCSNVIHKVVGLLSSWLLQQEIAPFVASGEVSPDSCALLLVHTLLSFFNSPYLYQPGERVNSAISTAYAILRTCRALGSPSLSLQRPLSPAVWGELISRVADSATRMSSLNEAFSQETAAAFANTLFTLILTTKTVRRVPLEDRLWEESRALLDNSLWVPTADQWAKALEAVTRGLVLRLIGVDISTKEEAQRTSQVTRVRRLREKERVESEQEESLMEGNDQQEEHVFMDTDDYSALLNLDDDGDLKVWLSTWRRLCLLSSPSPLPLGRVATSALTQSALTMYSLGLDALGTWVVELVLPAASPVVSLSLPALVAALNCPSAPPAIHSSCLCAITRVLPSQDPALLSSILLLRPIHLSLIAQSILPSLSKSVPSQTPEELVRVAAQLALSHTAAEAWLLGRIADRSTPIRQSAICTNSLCMVACLRGDCSLLQRVLSSLVSTKSSDTLLHIFASVFTIFQSAEKTAQVLELLLGAAENCKDTSARAEIQAAIAAFALLSPQHMRRVIACIRRDSHCLLEGSLVSFSGQFPLPSFSVARLNTVCPPSPLSSKDVFIRKDNVLLSSSPCTPGDVVCRSGVGRRAWSLAPLPMIRHPLSKVSAWLTKTAAKSSQRTKSGSAILGGMVDGLEMMEGLNKKGTTPIDSTATAAIVRNSKRIPRRTVPAPIPQSGEGWNSSWMGEGEAGLARKVHEWRATSLTMGFIDQVVQTPSTFGRNMKHLDQTASRETHKVAIIYVGKGQEDKNAILSNNSGSPAFESFVSGLGWEMRVGWEEGAYSGGLPSDAVTLYHASPHSECVFHVSTRLTGDVSQRLKHIGNDEVHVVWNEHARPYRRDTIATQFCDVLFIVERASPTSLRISLQTRSELTLSPLWDGVVIPEDEAPAILRTACLNASRIYRLSRDTTRPLRHRETVFSSETRSLEKVSLSVSVARMFTPSMAECS